MKRWTQGVAIAVGLLIAGAAGIPATAAADTANVATAQVLPPGGTSCPTMQVLGVTPYVQNGQLQSFDVVIADPTYVALLAKVGESSIPFNYMSRWNAGNGALKIHVDVQSTPVRGSLPVSLTLISSPAGHATCLSVVSFTVLASGATTNGGTPTPSSGSHPVTAKPATVPTKQPATPAGTSTASSGSPVLSSTVQRNLEQACAASGAFQLWFVLLALFAVIVTITGIAQPPLAERSPALPLATILVPLVLLVAFWYFAPLCRAASWIPIVLVIAAILGLLAAFRHREQVAKVIQLPPPKTPKTP